MFPMESVGTEDKLWLVSCSDGLGDGSALRMDCTYSQNFWRQRLFIFHGSEVTWKSELAWSYGKKLCLKGYW